MPKIILAVALTLGVLGLGILAVVTSPRWGSDEADPAPGTLEHPSSTGAPTDRSSPAGTSTGSRSSTGPSTNGSAPGAGRVAPPTGGGEALGSPTTAEVRGVTLDGVGQPVPDTEIQAWPAQGTPTPLFVPPSACTDRHGAFTLRLAVGHHLLRAQAPGLRPASRSIEILPGMEVVEVLLVLDPGASLHGQVRTPEGAPVPGALVLALEEPIPPDLPLEDGLRLLATKWAAAAPGESQAAPRRATCTADGTFDLGGLDESTLYRVFVIAEGHEATQLTGVRPGPALAPMLQPAPPLAGRVRDARGAVAGARVRVYPVTGAALLERALASALPMLIETATDADGAFALPPPGPQLAYRLEIESDVHLRLTLDEIAISTTALDLVLESGAWLHGGVRTQDGQPVAGARLAGARVDEQLVGRRRLATHTDAGGRFALGPLPDGARLEVVVEHRDHPLERVGLLTVPGPQLDLVLAPGHAFAGRITSAPEAAPIAGARVQVRDAAGSAREVVSDMDGRFRATGLRCGPREVLDVVLEAPGFARRRQSLPCAHVLQSTSAPLEFTLEPAATLAGEVVDAEGQGVGGCPVVLRAVRDDAEMAQGVTDARGAFTLAGLTAGQFVVEANPAGRPPARSQVVRLEAGASYAGLRLLLARGGSIDGQVLNAVGEALAGAQWALYAGQHVVASGSVRADGSFRFEGLAPGRYVVQARAPGHRARAEALTITGSAARSVVLLLPPPARVAGIVQAAGGAPIAGAQVTVIDLGDGRRRSVRSDAMGRFVCQDLGEHGIDLLVSAPGHATTVLRNLAGDHLDLEVVLARQAALIGQVIDPSGTPITSFQVQVHLWVGDRVLPARPAQAVRTADGYFELTGLDPGVYDLRVGAPGRAVVTVEGLRVASERVTDAGRIPLQRAGEVRGVILDLATRQPVEAAIVRVVDPDAALYPPLPMARVFQQASAPRRGQTTTGPDGAFLLGELLAGDVEIEVLHDQFLPLHGSAQVDGPTLEVALESGGVVEGWLLEAPEQPLPGALLVLSGHGQEKRVVTDQDGRFRFGGLVEGEYVIRLLEIRDRDPASPEREEGPLQTEVGTGGVGVTEIEWQVELPGGL